MARLYEWEKFLTPNERMVMARRAIDVGALKSQLVALQSHRDEIRRKAVQRARNAMNKELRRQAKEKAQ